MSYPPCDAGRDADFGGRWAVPCSEAGIHSLAFSDELYGPRAGGTPVLRFCERHIKELIAAGLIEEPAIDMNEWRRRGGE